MSEQIRTMHRHGFRCGQWADLLTTAPAPDKSDCYVVRFDDGKTDYWVVNDPDGQYEFRALPLRGHTLSDETTGPPRCGAIARDLSSGRVVTCGRAKGHKDGLHRWRKVEGSNLLSAEWYGDRVLIGHASRPPLRGHT